MKRHSLRIEPLGLVLRVNHGTSLYDLLKSFMIEFPCGGKGICGNCKVRILAGSVFKDIKHQEILNKKNLSFEWCLACYSKVEDDLVIEIPEGKMKVQSDETDIDVQYAEQGFAVAVDLGSTTVVSQLVDLSTGKVMAECSGINPQSSYGADIVSRMSYAIENIENKLFLSGIIRSYIGEQINELKNKCDYPDIKKIRIVGNSVMHNLFSGFDVSGLSKAPFQSEHNNLCRFRPKDLSWDLSSGCIVEFLPNIGHFVGSDVLGGIVASGIMDSEKYSLLVDLGTNGEIVLGNKEGFLFTSTAAGPAFEGINISCGMRAAPGAISEVEFQNGSFVVSTIGDSAPEGICGSGLVDTVSCLLKNGLIDFTGAIQEEGKDRFEISDGIFLSIEDIREFQLAKAAIATGIQILLNHSSLSSKDISNVYITGGLGNYINVDNIRFLGIIPEIPESKYKRISNAALLGCKKLLYDEMFYYIDNILGKSRYCSLETDSSFAEIYCNNMFFANKVYHQHFEQK